MSARLERSCVSPGHWRVEGFDVERTRVNGEVGWRVFSRYAGQPELIHGHSRTFSGACELIYDLLVEQGRAS